MCKNIPLHISALQVHFHSGMNLRWSSSHTPGSYPHRGNHHGSSLRIASHCKTKLKWWKFSNIFKNCNLWKLFQDKNLFQAGHAITGSNIILELHTLLHPTNKKNLFNAQNIYCNVQCLICAMYGRYNLEVCFYKREVESVQLGKAYKYWPRNDA